MVESHTTEVQCAKDIWIYGDLRNQSLFDTSLNVLCGAEQLAASISSKRVFVIITTESDTCGYTEEMVSKQKAVEQAVAYGADTVLVIHVKKEKKSCLLPKITARVLADIVKQRSPLAFLFPLNDIMREISARCAFICDSGMIADCQQLKYENSEIIAVCPSHGGEIMAELGFSSHSKTGFITIQPNAFKKRLADKTEESEFQYFGDVKPDDLKSTINHKVETVMIYIRSETDTESHTKPRNEESSLTEYTYIMEDDLLIKRLSITKNKSEEQSLENADKVVAGGAGLGNIEGFKNLRKLAAALGAQIGATRPPVLWHWTDDDRLIGQTGKTIRPELLISVGASGAVQYTAGFTEAKTVVAVNKDPNAPIFRFADIGIIEDASVFVPALTDKIQKIAMRALADTLTANERTDSANDRGVEGADFGSKLMQMRKAHQMTYEDLAKRTGRTPESIEELENNRTTPSVGFMIKLSEVFGIDAGTFLNDDERATLSGNRAKEYTRRTGNYYYQTLTPGAENEHLRVFMVTIEANKKHKPVAYRHEGEEFIYVMDGILELILEGKSHKLMPGESMKFNSETSHQLKSLGAENTKCLVTLYTP